MRCIQCGTEIPPQSRYCAACGTAIDRGGGVRRSGYEAYRVQPGEQVAQLALISTLLPHADREWADHYRWALAAGAVAVIVLTLTGFLPAAVAAGAVLLPSAYLLYLWESGVWLRSAAAVVAGALLPAMLGVVVTLAFITSGLGRHVWGVLIASQTQPGLGHVPLGELLAFIAIVSLGVAIFTSAGPILLVRRPEFDDLLDGFTFGVAAGLAYSAGETVASLFAVFRAPGVQTEDPLFSWVPILVGTVFVKPIIYAVTAGVAVSAYSGKGTGYDGFTRSYAGSLGLSALTIAVYWLGMRVLSLSPAGPMLGLVWGLVVLVAVILRARRTLQDGLLERAIHDAADGRRSSAAPEGPVDCPECEMPLLPRMAFCASCGVSVRATSAGLEARAGRGAVQA